MKTLLTETKWCRFEPSDDLMNPYLQIITHKTRPVLAEVLDPNQRPRRSLSALLNSKKTDPLIDDDPSFLNNLHTFESTHVQNVSSKAPNKNPRPYSSLRQGRDPRTKNKRPFLTHEKAPMTAGERKNFDNMSCHMKVMTDRVQNYNKVNFVPKSKRGGTDAPLPPSSLNEDDAQQLKQTAEFAGVPANTHLSGSTGKDGEALLPSKIMENLKDSNCGDIVRNMSVNDQMKLIHNIMDNEQFKKETKEAVTQAAYERARLEEEQQAKIEQQFSDGCYGENCVCSIGDEASARVRHQKVSLETEEVEKENKVFRAERVQQKPKTNGTLLKGQWQTAEEYVPSSQRPSEGSESDKENSDANRETAKFHDIESLGNLDGAKNLKFAPVPLLDLVEKQKDPSQKQENTLKVGKWGKASPFKSSNEDEQKLKEYHDLKKKRYEREFEVVKKLVDLISPSTLPSVGNKP